VEFCDDGNLNDAFTLAENMLWSPTFLRSDKFLDFLNSTPPKQFNAVDMLLDALRELL
jgi:hypothetical protein